MLRQLSAHASPSSRLFYHVNHNCIRKELQYNIATKIHQLRDLEHTDPYIRAIPSQPTNWKSSTAPPGPESCSTGPCSHYICKAYTAQVPRSRDHTIPRYNTKISEFASQCSHHITAQAYNADTTGTRVGRG
jgi:hypothetical protein